MNQEPLPAQGPVDVLVGRLIEMHNNPPSKIGWMEQTTLRDAAEMLTSLQARLEQEWMYVGTVKYVRAGGNAGLAWYVAPDYESIEYGCQPNDGDRLYAVPPNAKVEADGAASCAGRASNDGLAGIVTTEKKS